jgi:hypothetical protein
MSIFEKIGAIGWKTKTLSVKFCFRNQCWWAPPRNTDDLDLNKLAGIGYGTNHHNNSVRLSWVPDFDNQGMIKVFGYTYDEKKTGQKFAMSFIKSVRVGQTVSGKIESRDNGYFITVGDVTVKMDNINVDPKLTFKLYPYFGGNNTAPHDMTIELEMTS